MATLDGAAAAAEILNEHGAIKVDRLSGGDSGVGGTSRGWWQDEKDVEEHDNDDEAGAENGATRAGVSMAADGDRGATA
jgi:hypothetical protein